MRKAILYLLLPVLFLTACSNDEENDGEKVTNANKGMEGVWKLVKIADSMGGPDLVFEMGTITWTFTKANTSVAIINNADEKIYSGMQTGNYNYMVAPNEAGFCKEILTIKHNDGIGGCVAVSNDTLTVTNAYAGHYNFIFVR